MTDFTLEKKSSVAVLGLGQIGLPLAVLAASKQHLVSGIDIDEKRISSLKNRNFEYLDPSLAFFLQDQTVLDNLTFAANLNNHHDIFVICVPTSLDQKQNLDLSAVKSALNLVKNWMAPKAVIIIESTLSVGMTESLATFLENETGKIADQDFFLVYSPERLLPGNALQELVFNDRVLGASSSFGLKKAEDFYKSFIQGEVFLTTTKTAELTKLIENCHRVVEIAFANEVAEIANNLQVDASELIKLANRHPRVKILTPGIGIGGDCLPVHPYFLKESLGFMPSLIAQGLKINFEKEKAVAEEIIAAIEQKALSEPKVLILGLSYKKNVADLRNSPALKIALTVKQNLSGKLFVADPLFEPEVLINLGFSIWPNLYDLSFFDAVVLLVEHDCFLSLLSTSFSNAFLIDPLMILKKMNLKESFTQDLQTF